MPGGPDASLFPDFTCLGLESYEKGGRCSLRIDTLFSRLKFSVLSLICLGVTAFMVPVSDAGQGSPKKPSARPPNVILILADDLGYGDLGCYGATLQRTPHLDQMAAEGIRFTDFSMSSSVCSPSRASILTGCFHKRVGINSVLFPVSRAGLNPEEETMAELLRRGGYATRCFGKWHLGDQPFMMPVQQGFDDYLGIPYSHDMRSLVRIKKQEGDPKPIHIQVLPLVRGDKVERLISKVSPLMGTYHAEIDSLLSDFAREKKPFFIYLAYHAVHLPNEAPEQFLGSSRNGAYGDWIEAMDFFVGFLLEGLAREGLDQDTVVLFTSDNGPSSRNRGSAGPFRGFKHSDWEGGRRVPLIIRWPGHILPGQVTRAMAGSMDLFPTVAAMAGVPLDPARKIDGVDLGPLMYGGKPPAAPLRTTFAYYAGEELRAVREGTWKLHLRTARRPTRLLYQLDVDPGEAHNVIGEHPDVVERLLALAESFRAELGDHRKQGAGERPAARSAILKPLFDALSHPGRSDDSPEENVDPERG